MIPIVIKGMKRYIWYVIPILYENAFIVQERTAQRENQSPTVGNPPTALVHQVRQEIRN
jgi:hypothetical protein